MKKIFTLMLLSSLYSCSSGPATKSNSDTTKVDTTTVKSTDKDAESDKKATSETKTKWEYSEDEDKMTSKKNYYANIESDNKLQFEFPYDGGSKGGILVRNQNGKNEVVVSISKGQFNTHSDGTPIKVRFDEGKATTFTCGESSDNDTKILFVENPKKFIKLLKASKKAIIQAEFYEAGLKEMEFTIAGFKWEH